MQQAFHQQNVFAADIWLMAEENFQDIPRSLVLLLAIPGLDELADDRNLECPYQVGHEHESILQQCHSMQGLAAIIIGNLPRYLPYPLLDLLRGDHDTQLFRL